MNKSSQKNGPDMEVDISIAYILSDHATDLATTHSQVSKQYVFLGVYLETFFNFVTSCGDLISGGALANRK